MDSLKGFAGVMNRKVEGVVTMRIYKGRCEAVAISSKFSLNNENSSFMKDNFNQNASAGFIEHFGYTQRISYNLK
jgi:argininosuccinate synthase